MCEFCDPETIEAAQKHAASTAELMERVAHTYRQMAGPRYKPHLNESRQERSQAQRAIRRLAEDWL